MSLNDAIFQRRLGLNSRIEIDFAADRFRLKEAVRLPVSVPIDVHDGASKTPGPMASAWLNDDIITIASEDGTIYLLQADELKVKTHWMGHKNAIFDIKVVPGRNSIMTASGDRTLKLWDIETQVERAILTPHHSSIKSISFYDSSTVASASRDGSIQIHDLRLEDPTVILIRDAHRNKAISKYRKSAVKTDPASCVTNVVFDQNFPRLYSTGANDATIKLWDFRRHNKLNKPRRSVDGKFLFNKPAVQVHHPVEGLHCGYSHLLISNYRVYAACSDNKIYCYESFGNDNDPIKFTGYQHDTSFKIAVMDDRFLFSGSRSGGATMWTLGSKTSSKYLPERTKYPIGQLKPDSSDRIDTSVIETDWRTLSVFTFREDNLACKWTMQEVRESERKKLAEESIIASQESDVTIEMSDIIDVHVVRPSHQITPSAG